MQTSISKKIFNITFGLIVLLVSASFFTQYFFFDNFYASKKEKALTEDVSRIKTLFSTNKDKGEIYKALSNSELVNNSKIAIYSSRGQLRIFNGNENTNPISSSLLDDIYKFIIKDNVLLNYLKETDKIQKSVFEDKVNNLKCIVCYSNLSIDGDDSYLVIALCSYQEITDASSATVELYGYIAIGVLIIGLILSLIYSNMISKPLISINNVAKKMSSMDFSEKCPVVNDDEIGNLAKTLNFLSLNLSSVLQTLREKNKKLEQDIEKERKVEKLRKDFIAGVSHELKTPIGIIGGYAEGLKDNIASPESREYYLDVIIDESKKMNKMVIDMLELCKLENGQDAISISPFDMRDLCQNTIEKYVSVFKENNIKINIDFSAINTIVLGDEFRIEQVLTNFLTNALKYTPNNETVNILLKEKKDTLAFLIENTGVHIPNDSLQKIWHQFYRLDKSRSRALGSSGLGLSIIKNILTLHKSSFGVFNSKSGVVFYFDLKKFKPNDKK